jgi:tetratricopeptide (TPR) repeat protein
LVRQFYDWDWPGTERAFRTAIDLNPGHAEAHHELSMVLMRQKRFDEALREAQLSLSLAPMSIRFLNGVGEVQAYSGHPDEALATADQIVAIDPNFPGAFYIRGTAFEYLGQLDGAEQAWRDCVRVAPVGCDYARGTLGYIYAMTGRRAQALKVLDTLNAELRDATGIAAWNKMEDVATVHIGLGNRAEALTLLERVVERHSQCLYYGIVPAFRSLQEEPRFQALLKKIGLPS